jgi:hypothetical protein
MAAAAETIEELKVLSISFNYDILVQVKQFEMHARLGLLD